MVYGKRIVISEFNPSKSATVDTLLVDITKMKKEIVDFYKYLFWERFDLASDQYENEWDYEQYFRLGICYFDLLKVLYPEAKFIYHFSHEYMGVPSLLALEFNPDFKPEKNIRIFYAHEIAPVRRIIENHPGYDISFYNLLEKAKEEKRSLEEIFGSQMDWYRTALVKLTQRFDKIFAVGDLVLEEYKFLCPEIDPKKLKIVYNGLPIDSVSFEEVRRSREKFFKSLSRRGYEKIDLIFSHVCRLVKSKGIWRDLKLLYFLDFFLEKTGLRGIFFLLSTQIPKGREPELVERMVKEYNWPFEHRIGWPDLIGYEIEINELVERFNSHAKSLKAIFINQFGISKRKCGIDFPEEITTKELKIASDVELGFSIYEPFGISHIEVLPSGGLSLLSTSCGVYYILERIFKEDFKPYFGVNFINIAKDLPEELLLSINPSTREVLEELVLAREARAIFEKLPKNEKERRKIYEKVQSYLSLLKWETIVENFLIPALEEN